MLRFDKIHGEFAILPALNLWWFNFRGRRIYDLQFAWLNFMIMTTNYKEIEDSLKD